MNATSAINDFVSTLQFRMRKPGIDRPTFSDAAFGAHDYGSERRGASER
jgi:hypothetical protein